MMINQLRIGTLFSHRALNDAREVRSAAERCSIRCRSSVSRAKHVMTISDALQSWSVFRDWHLCTIAVAEASTRVEIKSTLAGESSGDAIGGG